MWCTRIYRMHAADRPASVIAAIAGALSAAATTKATSFWRRFGGVLRSKLRVGAGPSNVLGQLGVQSQKLQGTEL